MPRCGRDSRTPPSGRARHELRARHSRRPRGSTPRAARAGRCGGRPFLRDIDLLAAEHGVDARAQAGLLGEADEQRQCLIGDPVLRVVEIDARGFRRQPFAASRIAREQLTEMYVTDVAMVLFEGLPGWSLRNSSRAIHVNPFQVACSVIGAASRALDYSDGDRLRPLASFARHWMRSHLGEIRR